MFKDTIPNISRDEFVLKAIRDKDINFIAFVVTPWHAISLDATLLYMKSKGISMRGMVLISPHINSGINVTNDTFIGSNYDLYIEKEHTRPQNNQNITVDTTKKTKLALFLERRNYHRELYRYVFWGWINRHKLPELYIINQNNPETMIGLRVRRYRHARFIINDEGVGAYTSEFHMEAPIGDKWKGVRTWMNYFREEILARQWICKIHHAIHTTIFKIGGRPLIPNSDVLPYYNEVFVEHAKRTPNDVKLDLSDSIVIVPSVFMEEEEFFNGESVRIQKNICDVLHDAGHKLYMKPHPRDNFFRSKAKEWHCELIEREGFTTEELCTLSKPLCMIGCPSTALVTASLFFDVPTISIVDLMDQNIITKEAKSNLQEYKEMFDKLVQYPRSIQELVGIIESAQKRK